MSRKTILITGCSSGIGYDAAHALQRRGWRVFASCRKAEDCQRVRAEGLESPRIDYDDPASIENGLAEVLNATGGTLGALYNNGAIGIPGLVEDVPRAAMQAIYDTNLFGPHDLTRRVIPVMRAQGFGRIVNCSSVFGYAAFPWRGAYISTKHALEGLTDVLRMELRGTGIHVCLIEPGLITTKFGENSGRYFERWIDWQASADPDGYRKTLLRKRDMSRLEAPASDVTRKLIHALENPRPRARYRVTKLASLVMVLDRLLPTRAVDWITGRIA